MFSSVGNGIHSMALRTGIVDGSWMVRVAHPCLKCPSIERSVLDENPCKSCRDTLRRGRGPAPRAYT